MNVTDTNLCPLCGSPNDCQLCTPTAYKGPCWCDGVEIPETLIAQVPTDLRNKSIHPANPLEEAEAGEVCGCD